MVSTKQNFTHTVDDFLTCPPCFCPDHLLLELITKVCEVDLHTPCDVLGPDPQTSALNSDALYTHTPMYFPCGHGVAVSGAALKSSFTQSRRHGAESIAWPLHA